MKLTASFLFVTQAPHSQSAMYSNVAGSTLSKMNLLLLTGGLTLGFQTPHFLFADWLIS